MVEVKNSMEFTNPCLGVTNPFWMAISVVEGCLRKERNPGWLVGMNHCLRVLTSVAD